VATEESARWVRVTHEGAARYGRIVGEGIALIDGTPFEGGALTGVTVPLKDTPLLAPVIPPTFYACGINYAGHAHTASAEFGKSLESFWPTSPEIGYRAQSAITGHGQPIVLPVDAPPNVQAEGELAVVIGRTVSKVSEADALACVFGYTICNDVSQREWQFADRTFWRAKNSDTFKPIGPWIVTGVDLEGMTTRIFVNDRLVEEFATNNMLFGVAKYISVMSRYITLVPGDVIIMGTDGTAPRIGPGDRVAIEIEGIGTLSNPVVRADGA
jgi:2-keto-4-pentenoate hydratase/2-oxohepta-3-ene-1,7-dioic acid hydratase in catechol pathway